MALSAILVDRYSDLKARLARRLGATELAAEALQETWLRLQRPGYVGALQRPDAYLFRVALNIAADHRVAERRRLALSEVEALRHADDDELDPERIIASRAEIAALADALDELPQRRRAIFLAARLDELPHKIIAERHGVSTRLVERELKLALEHCSERLGRGMPARFGAPPREPSKE
ncbi:RNA polymerase sigma factor [Methylosinus sp. Sm6]|nr:RNA polymerase sigma factor [Methylosinus sp. Sm6]MBY6242344.1 RNA polymerase sigma factor [Methylosinus sp. Sm6]